MFLLNLLKRLLSWLGKKRFERKSMYVDLSKVNASNEDWSC